MNRYIYIHLRVCGRKLLYKAGEKEVANGDAGTDAKRTHVFPVTDSQLHLIEQGDDVERVIVEHPSLFCDVEPSGDPVKQAYSVVILQLTDSQADGRLGQVELFGSPGNSIVLVD